MASGVYNRGKAILGGKSVTAGPHVWGTTSVGVLLVTSTYTPNADHNFVSDITNELSGGGYARLTAIASQSITEDDTNDRVDYVGQKVTFPSLGAAAGTPRYAIVFDRTGASDAARELLGWVDLTAGAPTPDGNNYEVRWNGTDGVGVVLRLT